MKKKDATRGQPDPSPEKGDVYIWRCIDVDSRIRIASHCSKTREIQDATVFLGKVADRLACPRVLFTSDKLKAYLKAIKRVFGLKVSTAGRLRIELPEGLLYGRIVKVRESGHLRCVKREAAIGTDEQIQSVLEMCGCQVINTSFVERDNGTFRQHNGRVVRKTLSYSKNWQMHQHAIEWEDAVHNFARPHSSLRLEHPGSNAQKWLKRTPAMAAGITDHIWTIEELVTYRLPSRE